MHKQNNTENTVQAIQNTVNTYYQNTHTYTHPHPITPPTHTHTHTPTCLVNLIFLVLIIIVTFNQCKCTIINLLCMQSDPAACCFPPARS